MTASRELLLKCSPEGLIVAALSENLPDAFTALPGKPLVTFLAPGSLDQGLHLLRDVKLFGRADSRLLELTAGEFSLSFMFSGAFLQDHIILAGIPAALAVQPVNNSETSALQLLPETEPSLPEQIPPASDNELLEEMSRLNNELINTKRELIRKNMELERLQKKLGKG